MADRYNQNSSNTSVHFSNALFGEVETSRMTANPIHLTTFNGGDLVPIYCREILPDETVDMSVDFVIRQTTLMKPTMGSMKVDLYAFFVPNRVVNQSWKAVQGENLSGSWTANSVSLATLVDPSNALDVKVPVGSVADYYGFPTQGTIKGTTLSQCNDLKFRGYVMIWNEWFRDQNYQPPIPMSTLNVFEGFFNTSLDGNVDILPNQVPDGSFGAGSVANALFGSGLAQNNFEIANGRFSTFNALGSPLKANKLHDYFTSVLPSPQKSNSSVFAPVTGQIGSVPVVTSTSGISMSMPPIRFNTANSTSSPVGNYGLAINNNRLTYETSTTSATLNSSGLSPANLVTQEGATVDGLALSVDDIRMASAIQQVYETLSRGGSRYRELISSFFGLEVEDPFSDIPQCVGHLTKELDLFQTAQTSQSVEGVSPQGNLAGFGYTTFGGKLCSQRFIEHGYLHVFAVVRHRNIYPTYLAPDNFRLNMLDFYTPPLANIAEQPVFARTVNPFCQLPDNAFGYQEAWAEYRFEPDTVSGLMRPGVPGSLAVWNYADNYNQTLQICDGDWLKSNSQEVLDRTIAVTSALQPQFLGQFRFNVDKTLPMPTYSVPGMDII